MNRCTGHNISPLINIFVYKPHLVCTGAYVNWWCLQYISCNFRSMYEEKSCFCLPFIVKTGCGISKSDNHLTRAFCLRAVFFASRSTSFSILSKTVPVLCECMCRGGAKDWANVRQARRSFLTIGHDESFCDCKACTYDIDSMNIYPLEHQNPSVAYCHCVRMCNNIHPTYSSTAYSDPKVMELPLDTRHTCMYLHKWRLCIPHISHPGTTTHLS